MKLNEIVEDERNVQKKVDVVQPVSTTVEYVPDPVSVLHDKKNHPVLA